MVLGTDAGVIRIYDEEPGVDVPTWEDDIAPINQAKCAMCHGPDAVATDLSTMSHWIAMSDDIVLRVKTDMPANDPPLDPNLTAQIEAWIDGGYAP